MRITKNRKIISEEYPNEHPPIEIFVKNQKECNALTQKIQELYTILESKKIKCSRELKNNTISIKIIVNQFDQESTLLVQQFKQELADFVKEYKHKDLWNVAYINLIKIIGNFSLLVFEWSSLDNVTKKKIRIKEFNFTFLIIIVFTLIVLGQEGTLNKYIKEESELETFINNYYSLLDNGKYTEAWEKLSPRFQNNKNLHPEGFSSFKNNWSKNKSIRVDFLQSKCQDNDNQPSIKALVRHKSAKNNKENKPDKICFYFTNSSLSDSLLINEALKAD